jgi:CMP-N,N'-diacetyllegionaminic acid synthase
MSTLAIVPARAGSMGIPGKNMIDCAGQPLIAWTMDAIFEARIPPVITTDDIRLASLSYTEICASIGANDQIEDRLDPIIQKYDPKIIVLLQPTSPVRTGQQITEAIAQLQYEEADSLLSVVRSHSFLWVNNSYLPYMADIGPHKNSNLWTSYDWQNRANRQDMQYQYEENGSIYVFTREHWEQAHNRLGGHISLYVMPEECRIQVDTPWDLWMSEQILLRQHALV